MDNIFDLRFLQAAAANASAGAAAAAPPPQKAPTMSKFVQGSIIFVVALSVLICCYYSFYNWYVKNHREKTNLVHLIGLAMAYIVNEEEQNPFNIVENGVGV